MSFSVMEESEGDEYCPRPRGVNVMHFVKERVRQIAELIQVGFLKFVLGKNLGNIVRHIKWYFALNI